MAFLKNTISLLAVFCVIPAAFGASSRVGVVTTTAARMPTLRTITGAISSAVASSTASSSASLMGNTECIDAYTECIKADDVCGSDLEECTTNVLFHGKMPLCFSTLYQCSTSGINTLFGTSAIDALSNVATKNNAGEVTRYTYPTDGSVLGQLIIGAKISNQYKDSATCVKKYKSCMYRDTVCGEDFELCTDANSFKKQAPTCDSVLALCPSAGVTELFGVKDATMRPVTGFGSGVVAEWVSDGADLAAANAVNTCYKVVDNCFLSACGTNPYRCVEDVDLSVIETADIVGVGEESKQTTVSSNVGKQSASDVRKFFKSACIDTIGTNKYCYMTVNEGKSPKKTELTDPDAQEDLFSDLYTTRKTYINTKLQTLVENFDTKAKKSCTDAIKSCAMRSCGGGSGAACYTQVFGDGGTQSINSGAVYNEIKRACEPVINTNPACRYSAAAIADGETYSYAYIGSDVFTTLFGDGTAATFADPIGAVAALNSSLATTYNAAGIAQLQKQCENVATNCVKSMCGTDYVNCYRSRNDISGEVYTGGTTSFNKSMNKLGGVLDYNVVIGLCQNTVKNSPACEEHLSIVKAEINEDVRTSLWGGNTVADSWLGTTVETKGIQATDANGAKLCQCENGGYDICDYETSGVTGCSTPYMTDVNTAVADRASATLFQNLLSSIEKEAQGLYQGKLTKQRNMCEAENNGGIVGTSDMTSSTFMWAKLAGNGKVPNDYSTQGLSSKQFVQTNDLYGGFCRIRVDVKSSDIYINQYLGDASVRYFAAGDAFTCGSWITNEKLTEITEHVAENAVDSRTKDQQKRTRGWITALGTIGGAIGGFAAMDAIQNGKGSLGGLLSNKRGSKQIKAGDECIKQINAARDEYDKYNLETDATKKATYLNTAISKANAARREAQQAGLDVDDISFTGYMTAATKGSEAVYGFESSGKKWWDGLLLEINKVKQSCKINDISTTEIEMLLTTRPDQPDKDYTSEAQRMVNPFITKASTVARQESMNSDENKNQACIDANARLTQYYGSIQTTLKSLVVAEAVNAENAKFVDFKPEDFDKNINALEKACEVSSDKGKDERMGTNLAVGAVLGAGLGVTSYLATRDIQLLKNEKAEQEAIDEWMNNIGNKIKCYIGSEEVGSYGDIISTEL